MARNKRKTDGTTAAAVRGKAPKYSAIAHALIHQIQTETYKVGERLPSEPELCASFGVSRYTVRAALRSLFEQGFIASRQGVGTVVRAATANPRYSYAFESLDDLLQYANATRVRVVEARRIEADAELEAWLASDRGACWWIVRTLRTPLRGKQAVACSHIYVPDAFAAIVPRLRNYRHPIFTLLEQHYGERIAEIRQTLSVAMAAKDEALALGLENGAPIMCVVRRYFNAAGRVLEVSRSVHPAETFEYAMTVRLTLSL